MTKPAVHLGDGFTVSTLGLGGMALASVYGGVEPAEALRTLHHAVDAGITFIDTADVYGAGGNEELIARLVKERRSEVQLATKFGIVANPKDGYPSIRGDARYIREAVDNSLRRLGTDVIDLYYMHRRDLRVPIVETVEAMAGLVQQGKVKHLGLSEVTAEELREADSIHPIAAVQSEWSIWSRDVERNVVPAARELGVGFVPYAPLGRGFLTGTVTGQHLGSDDLRHRIPRFANGALAANQSVVAAVQAVARELSEAAGQEATPAQVALAWLLAQGQRLGLPVVPIPGTRKAQRIDENLGALSLQLGTAQLEVLDAAGDATVGARSADLRWVSQGREQRPHGGWGGNLYGAVKRSVSPLLLLLGMAALTIPMGLAVDTWSLALLSIPTGLLPAAILSACSEKLADLVDEERLGEVMGWYGSALTAGVALGAPLSGVFIDMIGPTGGFAAVGSAGVVLSIAGLVLMSRRTVRSTRV